MTGSFYCVPSGKATVIYQVYEGAKLRYKYNNEDWQEITPNNGGELTYTTEELPPPPGQCPVRYKVDWSTFVFTSSSTTREDRCQRGSVVAYSLTVWGPVYWVDSLEKCIANLKGAK